jgi:hypothetical protein
MIHKLSIGGRELTTTQHEFHNNTTNGEDCFSRGTPIYKYLAGADNDREYHDYRINRQCKTSKKRRRIPVFQAR